QSPLLPADRRVAHCRWPAQCQLREATRSWTHFGASQKRTHLLKTRFAPRDGFPFVRLNDPQSSLANSVWRGPALAFSLLRLVLANETLKKRLNANVAPAQWRDA